MEFKDCKTFLFLGEEIDIISDQVNGVINTVAQYKEQFYYLGSEGGNFPSAVLAWEYFNGRILNGIEFRQVLIENKLIDQT